MAHLPRRKPTPPVRIVTPPSGAGHGTKLFTEDGTEIPNVLSADIRIRPDEIVRAEVSVVVGRCDITAHPLLSLETVEEAAQRHGYRLVRIED